MDRIPITNEGFETLKKELELLKSVERPANIKSIEVARAHGDLSENAEYDAAKERQAFLEARINDLTFKIANADVINPDEISKDRVVFASKLILENIDTGDEVTYQLVGQDESDIGLGKVSISSPIGKALLGKVPGDEIVVQAPGGKRSYELIEII